jgi:hypothetical protein
VLPVDDNVEISTDDPENEEDNPDIRLVGGSMLLADGIMSVVDVVLLAGNKDDKSDIRLLIEESPVDNDKGPGSIPNTDKSYVI